MTGAGSAEEPHGRGDAERRPAGLDGPGRKRDGRWGRRLADGAGSNPGPGRVVSFLRANPQVFVLLVVCVVLGLGTFLAVLFGLLTAGSDRSTGEPSGVILGARALTATTRSPLALAALLPV